MQLASEKQRAAVRATDANTQGDRRGDESSARSGSRTLSTWADTDLAYSANDIGTLPAMRAH
jgi:hypothetical protein